MAALLLQGKWNGNSLPFTIKNLKDTRNADILVVANWKLL